MTVRDFIFKNYHLQLGFATENNYYSMKHTKGFVIVSNKIDRKKIPDPHNAKEQYQSFLRRNPRKTIQMIKDRYSTNKIFKKLKY